LSLHLPAVNASLNGLAAVLLVAGLIAIKSGARKGHERLMLTALVVSAAFLGCYLYYHFAVARGIHTRFNGTGWTKPTYYALLLSHTILAVVNLPMVLRTFWLAHEQRWDAHRRWAKWTFPIWLYVSVTGVAVYLVLYHFNPPAPVG
jgi:putative membrane protein